MSDPYHAIAAIYDAEFEGADADIAGYDRRGTGGPLLVLGCGTGRVCRGLERTRAVTGLDRSPAMLARTRGISTYVLGDMTAFDLGKFNEVIAPNAAFSFLHRRDEQFACLRAVRASLSSGGVLTIDVPMPDFVLLGAAHSPEAMAWSGWVDGREVKRTREVFRSPVEGRLDLHDRFYEDDQLIGTSHLPLRLIFPREMEWLLESAGFYVDALWGDHREGPLREGCDRLLVRAVAM